MDFALDEHQRALADTVQRFVARDYGFAKRRAIRDSAPGWSREAWQALADLGVLALNIDETHGGLGCGPLETGLVMNAFGAGLLLEPYLAAAVIAPDLLRRLAAAEVQTEWLPRIATGAAIIVLAHFEPGAQHDATRINTLATRTGDGYALSGHKAVVAHAGAADRLLVSARLDDGRMAVFLVTPGDAGVSLCDYQTLDGQRAADIVLRDAAATKIDAAETLADAHEAIAAALDVGLAALCFEAVGIMEASLAATAGYLKTRRQFGQPIGRFQALQHRMADMLLHLEQARSMSYLAAQRCTGNAKNSRQHALSAAKVTIGQACRHIAQNAVQLHGAMGMTDELIVSHWFKRLTAIEMSLGDTDSHLRRFVELSRAT